MMNTFNRQTTIKINNATIDVSKEEIVTEFVITHRKYTYPPKIFAKKMIVKCLKTLGFIVVFMIPALLVPESNVRTFFFFFGPIFGRLIFANDFNKLLGTESFKDLISGLERFYWLCDMLEHQVRYLTVEELLNTDYIYNASVQLKMLYLIMNGKLDICRDKDHSVYGYNMEENEKFRIEYICEPYMIPNEQCTYDLTLHKDYICFHEIVSEQTVTKKKTKFEEKVPKLEMKKDKYDGFRETYNKVVEEIARY